MVATFNDTAKFMSPNVPVPTELPFGSAAPQLAAGQNPANACPKDRTHSMPKTAKAVAINAARTVTLRKIVRIAYICSFISLHIPKRDSGQQAQSGPRQEG